MQDPHGDRLPPPAAEAGYCSQGSAVILHQGRTAPPSPPCASPTVMRQQQQQQLPSVEETPLLVLRFSPMASRNARLLDLVSDRLGQDGLKVLSRTTTTAAAGTAAVVGSRSCAEARAVFAVTVASASRLDEAAEAIHLVKRTSDGIMERFALPDRHRFVGRRDDEPRTVGSKQSSSSSSSPALPMDPSGLYTAGDWSLLAQWLWEHVKVVPSTEDERSTFEGDRREWLRHGPPRRDRRETELSKLLRSEYNADCRVHLEWEQSAATSVNGSSSSSRRRRVETLRQHQEESDSLGHVLRSHGLLESVSVPHLPAVRDTIFLDAVRWDRLRPDSDLIQSYYGCDVAFYFEWMGFLSRWLVVPGGAGVLVYLWRWHRGDTLDEDEYTPFYGIFTFFWAVLFVRFWERHEKRVSYRWGTCLLTDYERQKYFAVRDSFRGYLRLSPITGEPEVFYPAVRRRVKYVGSALVTLAMLSVAFIVMVLSLNLQGYIRPKSNPARWNESSPHPFHCAAFALLAEPGNWFDATSWWRSLLPPVIHAACINALNKLYRTIAEALTNWENHETEHSHNNSYALKRFLFEAFDCYIALFYLAFYERDVERLKLELVTVFQIDTFRRVACECLLPMLLLRLTGTRVAPPKIPSPRGAQKDGPAAAASSSRATAPAIPPTASLVDDLEKDVYDEFDDYMEILIQFGYTTLFASAYPLASLVSVAANYVEVRSDLFKLSYLDQRPFPSRSSDLGIWRSLLSCLVWTSALTNCLLAGFTSDQLMHYLPSFYLHDKSGYTTMEHDRGWLLVFVIFGLERLLLVLGMLAYVIVPDVPEDVTDELERRRYVHDQRLRALQSSRRLKKDK